MQINIFDFIVEHCWVQQLFNPVNELISKFDKQKQLLKPTSRMYAWDKNQSSIEEESGGKIDKTIAVALCVLMKN